LVLREELRLRLLDDLPRFLLVPRALRFVLRLPRRDFFLPLTAGLTLFLTDLYVFFAIFNTSLKGLPGFIFMVCFTCSNQLLAIEYKYTREIN
jgi:hypothetical protein